MDALNPVSPEYKICTGQSSFHGPQHVDTLKLHDLKNARPITCDCAFQNCWNVCD